MNKNKVEQWLISQQKKAYTDIGLGPNYPERQQALWSRYETSSNRNEQIDSIHRGFSRLSGNEPLKRDFDVQRQMSDLLQEAKKRIVSPLEDPTVMIPLGFMSEYIEKGIKNLEHQLPFQPLIGSLPTLELNALAARPFRDDNYVIIFNKGIFTFLHSCISALQLMQFSALDKNLRSQAIQMFGKGIENYFDQSNSVVTGVEGARVISQDVKTFAVEQKNVYLALVVNFIMAHEYAHILCKHHETSERNLVVKDGHEIKVISNEWAEEVQADIQGLQIAIASLKTLGLPRMFALLGFDVLFSCIDILEKIIYRNSYRDLPHRTDISHPPARVRRSILRDLIDELVPQDTTSYMFDMTDSFNKLLNYMAYEYSNQS